MIWDLSSSFKQLFARSKTSLVSGSSLRVSGSNGLRSDCSEQKTDNTYVLDSKYFSNELKSEVVK